MTSTSATTSTASATSSGSDEVSTSAVTTDASTTDASTVAASTPNDSAGSTDDSSATCFLCPPDGGGIAEPECDPWQPECPDGEKCTWWGRDGDGTWTSTRCVPIDPSPVDVGDPCSVLGDALSGLDDCIAGALCWDVDPETRQGRCVTLCAGDEGACIEDFKSCCGDPGTICRINSAGVALCLESCDPLLLDCESPGEVCYPFGDTFECAPDLSGAVGSAGDPCEFVNGCDPGSYCGDPATFPGCDPDAAGCCVPFCDLDAPTCPPGTACAPWFDPDDPPLGYEDLGACLIPG